MPSPEQNDTALEAAVFRRLIRHLQTRTDVQNIDLMNLAGFCRNCLARWYHEAAVEAGAADTDSATDADAAKERVYGMPYDAWKQKYQTEATPEQQAAREKHDH